MSKTFTKKLAYSAMIAAVYAALTIATAFMSYGEIQFRISEAMTVLPLFFPFSAWGLFAGCILANLFSPSGVLDIIFGSLATLLAGLCTAQMGRKFGHDGWKGCILGCLMPVLFNAVIVGAVITFAYFEGDSKLAALPMNMFTVGIGEALVLFVVGLPLTRVLPRKAFFQKLLNQFK